MSSIGKEDPADIQANHVENSTDEDDQNIGPGYWRSFRFLGTLAAIVLMANTLFIGYSMPVS